MSGVNLNYLALGLGAGLGLVGYCIYFDHKRRQDPNYKENVRQRRERNKKAQEKQNIIELPPLNDKEATEAFFIRQIGIGEELIQGGDVDQAVIHFSYAVALCPQPNQLMGYMKELLPTSAFIKLTEAVQIANKRIINLAID